jgi:hypothetical protein
MLPRALAVTLAVLCVFAAQATASALHTLTTHASYFATDGTRYAIWGDPQTGMPVVLDTRTGRRLTADLPGRCTFDGLAAADHEHPGRA